MKLWVSGVVSQIFGEVCPKSTRNYAFGAKYGEVVRYTGVNAPYGKRWWVTLALTHPTVRDGGLHWR
jgi:hypothetical protein